MFVNKLFTYLTCEYLKNQKVFKCKTFNILFSYEDEDFQICISVPLTSKKDRLIV